MNFLNSIDRYILAAVLPRVESELALSDFEAGLLAPAFLVAYFATSPLCGTLGYRLSRTRLMAMGVCAWSAATAATGLMRSFGQLLIARSFVGVVPVGIRATAMAVSVFTIHVLGDAISPPIIGLLADVTGLARAVLIVPAAIAISGLLWSVTARFS